MGITTVVGGGAIRDVLVREIPLLLQPADLYAVPAMIGAAIFVVADRLTDQWVALVGTVLATGIRLLGLARGWRLPVASRIRVVRR